MSRNKTVIIGVGYKMYSGKDTVAEYWNDKYWTTRISFAAKLKSMVRDLYGLTDAHTDGSDKLAPVPGLGGITPREIMQRFGITKNQVTKQLQELIDSGLLEKNYIT